MVGRCSSERLSAEHGPLFRPIDFGAVQLSNRLVRSAHGTGLGMPSIGDDLVAYTARAAADGYGLIVIEDAAVHRSSPPAAGVLAWDDEIVAGYESLSQAVAPYRTVLFQQLMHSGGYRPRADGGAPWAPSAIPFIGYPGLPLEMTKAQIDELVEAHVAAARRARDGGLRGVEIHAAHGYLVAQFLSPLTNHRQDDYGGSLENRLRFAREILSAIRAELAGELAVGIRLSSDEAVAGGLTVEDTTEIALALEDLIDFVNLTFGNRFSHERMIAAMHEPHGYQLDAAEPIHRALAVPVVAGGRITSLAEAARVLERGQADLVSIVRASIADPELIRKTLAGRPEDVRPCIGCNHGCVGGIFRAKPRIGCAVNVGAGNELTLGDDRLAPTPRSGRVIVVGGGPAGLEAARVAALRGLSVVMFEAEAELGGQLAFARRAPLREEVGQFVDWAEIQLERLGVEVRLSTPVDGRGILAESPTAVIVATGSEPRRDGLQAAAPLEPVSGFADAPVWTSWDVLAGSEDIGQRVVVLDDVGHYEAIATVDALHRAGRRVTFVTPHAAVGPLVELSLSASPARARFGRASMTLLPFSRLTALTDGQALVRSIVSGMETSQPFDAAVFVCHNVPRRAIADQLRGQLDDVRVVGDADSPRFLQAAVRDAHLAARTI